jgi:hypothetical protein
MPDHRIRLTDRDIELASSGAQALVWALLPRYPELAHEYGRLVSRLSCTKAGGQPKAVRQARKRALQEASIPCVR